MIVIMILVLILILIFIVYYYLYQYYPFVFLRVITGVNKEMGLNGIKNYSPGAFYFDLDIRALEWDLNENIDIIHQEINSVAKNKEVNNINFRFLGITESISVQFPYLNKILSKYPNLININIDIVKPGNVKLNKELYCTGWRYEYIIDNDELDLGLFVEDVPVKYYKGQGIVWNPRVKHSIHNHTNKPRISISCDFLPRSATRTIKTRLVKNLHNTVVANRFNQQLNYQFLNGTG